MKEGDTVEFVDPRWKSDEPYLTGVVRGFYELGPDFRARVLSNSGHEWLLRVTDLRVVGPSMSVPWKKRLSFLYNKGET